MVRILSYKKYQLLNTVNYDKLQLECEDDINAK